MMPATHSSRPPGDSGSPQDAIAQCESLAQSRDRQAAQRTGIELEVRYGNEPAVLVAVARLYLETGLLADAKRALSIAARVLSSGKGPVVAPAAPAPPRDTPSESEDEPTIIIKAVSASEAPKIASNAPPEQDHTLSRGLRGVTWPPTHLLETLKVWFRTTYYRLRGAAPVLSDRHLETLRPLQRRWRPIAIGISIVLVAYIGCAQVNHQSEHTLKAEQLSDIGSSLGAYGPDMLYASKQDLEQDFELGFFESFVNFFVNGLGLPTSWGYEDQLRQASTLRLRRTILLSLYQNEARQALEEELDAERENEPKISTLAAAEIVVALEEPELDAASISDRIAKNDAAGSDDAVFQLVSGIAAHKLGIAGAKARFEKAKELDEGMLIADVLNARWTILSEGVTSAKPLLESIATAVQDVPHLAAAEKALRALAWAKTPDRVGAAPEDVQLSKEERAQVPVVLEDSLKLFDVAQALAEHAEDKEKLTSTVEGLVGKARSGELLANMGRLLVLSGYDDLATQALVRGRNLVHKDHSGLDYLDVVLKLTKGQLKAAQKLAKSAQVIAAANTIAAYERLSSDEVEKNAALLKGEIEQRPELAPLAHAGAILKGETKAIPEQIAKGLWSDLLEVDRALDQGQLQAAMRITASWPSTASRPLHRLRQARLARYQGKLTDAMNLTREVLKAVPDDPRALVERVYTLIAADRSAAAPSVVAKHQVLPKREARFMDGLVLAKTKGWVAAAAKLGFTPLPKKNANLPYTILVARALASAGDPRAGYTLKQLKSWAPKHPDAKTAAAEL